MNKKEFIAGLRKELSRLPREEIDAAVEYYEEYFAEAGEENEQQVIDSLGSCKKVANQIKSEYAVRLFDEEEKPTVKKGISAVWYVIIGLCSAPVAIPAAIALGVLVIAIFIAVAGCIVALFFGILGCFAAAGALVVLGVASVKVTLSTGLMFMGTGLAAMGLIAGVMGLFLTGVKALIRLIVKAAGKAHRRKKAEKRLNAGAWKRASGAAETDMAQTAAVAGADAAAGKAAAVAAAGAEDAAGTTAAAAAAETDGAAAVKSEGSEGGESNA